MEHAVRLTAGLLVCAGLCVRGDLPRGNAAEVTVNGFLFTIPDGFTLDVVAGPPLVDRPICADFDEQGALYVAESSGSNDNVQKQLAEKPHRILRLVDRDGDGRFDERTVFADRMMFPEGVLWHEGSVYVSAPPVIWKLTDADGDGVAEQREEWYDPGTLTGCANDLHGPYLGLDGWIYWCKGAFAEQTHMLPDGDPFVTRASHIFRRRPDGGPVEPVMTGGMDNPVEVVFTPSGERLFTTTFLQHPAGGLRDGIIHALYGGVYGKQHGVLDGHPRTGDLLPPLVHLGAAAPCGLARLHSDALGPDFQDSVVASLFNMQKITRHQLQSEGATFRTTDTDLVVCSSLDFHPTDVLESGDGSLLIVDTGGWYKLCCPTSQLWKPDLLGAIYRLRRSETDSIRDPYGRQLEWSELSPPQLAERLSDPRAFVRERARSALSRAGETALRALRQARSAASDPRTRLEILWTLCRIQGNSARRAIREMLEDPHATVRQAALHAVSVHRDLEARPQVILALRDTNDHVCRAAAETLGRIGDGHNDASVAVAALLDAAQRPMDRSLQHSITYALIELDTAGPTRRGLDSSHPAVQQVALLALDQMSDRHLSPDAVVSRLDDADPELRATALWILQRHPDYAPQVAGRLAEQLRARSTSDEQLVQVQQLLATFVKSPEIQALIGDALLDPDLPETRKTLLLRALRSARIQPLPASWVRALRFLLDQDNAAILPEIVDVARIQQADAADDQLAEQLRQIGRNPEYPAELRLNACAALSRGMQDIGDDTFGMLVDALDPSKPFQQRAFAADTLMRATLSQAQVAALLDVLPAVTPLEIERVLRGVIRSADDESTARLMTQMAATPAVASLPPDTLKSLFANAGAGFSARLEQLMQTLAASRSQQADRIAALLEQLPEGNIRRGQSVFNSEKTSCKACHPFGYLGGRIGPDLTRIGRVRTKRDLLEAVVFPSASFVRSYEPMSVITSDGLIFNGLIREESADQLTVITTDRKHIPINRSDIEDIHPSQVSIMPAGLEQQMTLQELADLLAFLEASR